MGVAPPSAYNSPGSKKKKKKSSGTASWITQRLHDAVNAASGYNAIFGAQNERSTLAEAIEKQAAAQKRQAEAKTLGSGAMTDPFTALQQQLFSAANGINVAPTPLQQLKEMATNQVAAQYDPQLNALANEMNMHQRHGKASEKEARKMYGALAQDYMSQMPDITAQFKSEDDATNQRYDQAQQQMNDEYKKNASQQDAVLKQLGVQAASQDASQQASDDQKYFQNQSNLDQQSALNQLSEQQMAQQDYQRNLGSNAKMAGENIAQDIGSQLRDYMDQASGQANSLQAQKSSAIQALLSEMQQQDASRVSSQEQQQFGNMMQLFNFQLAAQKAANSAAKQNQTGFGSPGTITSGLEGAQNYLASQYPDQPILASNLMEQLNDVLSNKDVVNGKFVLDPGDPSMGKSPRYSDVGQEYMMDLLRREFEKQGNRYGTGDINATMNALQAYLGKLR